jgi:hypothetical protein
VIVGGGFITGSETRQSLTQQSMVKPQEAPLSAYTDEKAHDN